MKPSLLEHYTSLAQHHREKLSVLASVYLTLGQVLIFTPMATFEQIKPNSLSPNQLVPDVAIFGSSAAALFTIITVGIFHHLCNLVAYATLRLDYERRCLVEAMKKPHAEWEEKLDAHLRARFSLSKVSGVIGIVCAGVIWGAICLRINYIVRHLYNDSNIANMFVGAFLVLQVLIALGYGAVVIMRARLFYQARDILKCIETDVPADRLVSRLQRCDISITRAEAELYRKPGSNSAVNTDAAQ